MPGLQRGLVAVQQAEAVRNDFDVGRVLYSHYIQEIR